MKRNHHKSLSISTLPREIFWMILDLLDPGEVIRCRRVARTWNQAFRDLTNLIRFMRRWFPLTREARELVDALHNRGQSSNGQTPLNDDEYWRQKFDHVACRYEHLRRAQPMSIQKYKLCDDFGPSGEREFFSVPPWELHASHPGSHVMNPVPETFWSYEDGLVVFPSADHHCLVLMDINSEKKFMVPFMLTGKVVRRIRLQERVLVVEWAELMAFHWLNDSDGVHRHFASSFDVEKRDSNGDGDGGWTVLFRNEWKIMFLGHPLSEQDRFFSTHTKTHYAIYIWQPNRSLYTADEDAPIESLMVWDISQPSTYRPSLDPTGVLKEQSEKDTGPSAILRLGFRELGFYTVRQRGIPAIQTLTITPDAQALEITENRSTPSTPVFLPNLNPLSPYECTLEAHLTSIPLSGTGPINKQQLKKVQIPPYRGNGGLDARPLCFSFGLHYLSLSECVDAGSQVCYSYNIFWPLEVGRYLVIGHPVPKRTVHILRYEDAPELMGGGRVFGTDGFVLGESGNREIVVWRFDR